MELREFAESVLFSTDLNEKLFAPKQFSDAAPKAAVQTPRSPGRPSGIPLISHKTIPKAPTPQGIHDETQRGLALHTFAHHELQALELMALALLKFPDAPAGFRRGLAKIICDEQEHFRLYMARAEHWGVGLGDAGVGHFFWDTVANLETPTAFLAALSLTYEQANLDFAQYWKTAFSAVDDDESVGVLQTVYEDEIRHVRHGLAWFERLAGRCDFETYSTQLIFPLSPGRAKGPIYNRTGRELVGFSSEFIDELEIRNVSRGRPPRIFTFDPFIEERIAGRAIAERMTHIAQDLAGLQMFLAHREDVVIARRPRLPTLQTLHKNGFEIPDFYSSEVDLGDREVGARHPWGHLSHPGLYSKIWGLKQRHAFAKAHPSALLLCPDGHACESVADARPFLGGNFIAKAALSASGQHRIRLDKPDAESWIARHIQKGPIVIEPWHERILDLSVQLDVHDTGPKILGVTRFFTRASGGYSGALIGPWTRGLTPDLARTVHGGSGRGVVQELLKRAGNFVGSQAHSLGYRGPMGIDAMLVSTPDGPKLQAILEVNPRTTMGRIALALHKRSGRLGAWFFVTDRECAAAGYSDRSKLIAAVEEKDGLMFTSEPEWAQGILTILSLSNTWQGAIDAWTDLGFEAPGLHR